MSRKFGVVLAVALLLSTQVVAILAYRPGGVAQSGEDKINGFKIELTATRDGKMVIRQQTLFHRSFKWRTTLEYLGATSAHVHSRSDGRTAWRWETVNGMDDKDANFERWQLHLIEAKANELQPFFRESLLSAAGGVGNCLNLFDPWSEAWQDFYPHPVSRSSFEKVDEKGLPVTEVQYHWPSAALPVRRYTFAKKDGIIRRYVHLLSKYEMVAKSVEINPKTQDADFEFTPPQGAKITDKTEEFIKGMTKDSP